MKKTLFLLPLTMLGVLSTTISTPHANAAKVYKQTATVYQMKKTGKAYKIASHTKKTTDQDINVGKTINVKGHRYYYSHVFKGYITDKAFALNAKLDAKRADVANSYKAKKQNKKTNNSSNYSNNHNDENTDNESNNNSNSNDNSEKPKIVDGYDENNQKIVDMNAFTNALTQISFNKLNEFRTSQGLQPLQMDNNLNKIAQIRAKTEAELHWNNTDSHYDSTGKPLAFDIANQLGINLNHNWGENAGEYNMDGLDHTADIGNQSVQDAIDEGPSGGHYQNDTDPSFTKCGIGFYVDDGSIGYVLELQ